jgi:hypothetical protein
VLADHGSWRITSCRMCKVTSLLPSRSCWGRLP